MINSLDFWFGYIGGALSMSLFLLMFALLERRKRRETQAWKVKDFQKWMRK